MFHENFIRTDFNDARANQFSVSGFIINVKKERAIAGVFFGNIFKIIQSDAVDLSRQPNVDVPRFPVRQSFKRQDFVGDDFGVVFTGDLNFSLNEHSQFRPYVFF